MTLFVDASAVVSVLTNEDDAADLKDLLSRPGDLLWSSVVRWEAAVALVRTRRLEPRTARAEVLTFGRALDFVLVPIGEREDDLAFEAYRTYGKGTGHPARLNMGDCFAYACAKANDARLLYKGDDFAMTDLAR